MVELRRADRAGVPDLSRRRRRSTRSRRASTAAPPLFDFTRRDGVQHTIWRVPDADAAALVDAFARIPRALHRRRPPSRGAAPRARAGAARAAAARPERGHVPRRGVSRRPGADPALQPGREGPRRPASRRVPRARWRRRFASPPGPAVPARKGEVAMYLAGHWYTIDAAAPRRPMTPGDRARRRAAAGPGARAAARHRRRAHRQADRLRRRRPRHRRARTRSSTAAKAAVAFSLYPGERRRPDGDLRRRRHHAAEVDVVRAEAARRPADPRDLQSSDVERLAMKVLVADKFEQSGLDGLKAAGCEVVYEPELKDDALVAGAARDAGRRAGRAPHEGHRADARRRAARRWSSAPAPATTRSTSRPRPRAASTSRTVRARTRSPSPSWPSA